MEIVDSTSTPDEDSPRISRLSSLFPVAEVLLAAAHSDKPPSAEEYGTVRRLLCELLGTSQLPARLEQRLAAFDPQLLDLAALAAQLEQRPVVGRRSLVELAREVCDADADLDPDEDRFMLALTLALSLDPGEVSHVVYASPFHGVWPACSSVCKTWSSGAWRCSCSRCRCC